VIYSYAIYLCGHKDNLRCWVMENEEKPKRGRKPKVALVEAVAATPAKKGRKPKAVYEVGAKAAAPPIEDEHVILKLNVIPPFSSAGSSEPLPYNNDDVMYSSVFEADKADEYAHVAGVPAQGTYAKSDGLKVVELLKDFEEKNKIDEWPQTTSIHCYWCCHRFDNAPYGIPVKMVNHKFYVFGCFCSLECAMAHNFSSRDSNTEIWERHNLINMLARKIGCEERIKPAPTRLALSMFGGHLSIEEFRGFSKTNKLININFPPMMTLTQQIEEINESDINNELRYIPVDTERINRYKEKIHLKRTKPINTSENTLDQAMNLKFGVMVS